MEVIKEILEYMCEVGGLDIKSIKSTIDELESDTSIIYPYMYIKTKYTAEDGSKILLLLIGRDKIPTVFNFKITIVNHPVRGIIVICRCASTELAIYSCSNSTFIPEIEQFLHQLKRTYIYEKLVSEQIIDICIQYLDNPRTIKSAIKR